MTDSVEKTPWYKQGPNEQSVPPGEAPGSTYLIGSADVALRVFLRRSAWNTIADFTADTHRPRGGILVGRIAADDVGPFIVIEGAIPAHTARPTGDGIAFAKQTWRELEQAKQSAFPDLLVVGWFHAHPGTGVALSGYDRLNAHRFFSEWWQLTYVIDQVRHRQAVYCWREGELKSLPGLWIWDENMGAEGEPAVAAAVDEQNEEYAATARSIDSDGAERIWEAITGRRRGAVAVFAALCLAFSLWAVTPLPGSLHWLKRQLDGYAAEAEQLQLELEHLRERHVQLNNELTRAEEQPRRTLAASEQVTDGPTQPLPETRPESTGPFPTARAPVSTHPNPGYVVRTGDTLWSISERLLGDPHAFWRLVELNDINDPDLILPGWQLTLPDGQERP